MLFAGTAGRVHLAEASDGGGFSVFPCRLQETKGEGLVFFLIQETRRRFSNCIFFCFLFFVFCLIFT